MVDRRLIATLLTLSFVLTACPNSTKPQINHSLQGNGQEANTDKDIAAILSSGDCLQVQAIVQHLLSLEQNEVVIYQRSAGLEPTTGGVGKAEATPTANSCYYYPETAQAEAPTPILEWISAPNLTESKLVGKYLNLVQDDDCKTFTIGTERFQLGRPPRNKTPSPSGVNVKTLPKRTTVANSGPSQSLTTLNLLNDDSSGENIIYREDGSQMIITIKRPVTVAGTQWNDVQEFVLNHGAPGKSFRIKAAYGQILQATLTKIPNALDTSLKANADLAQKAKGNKSAQIVDTVSLDIGSMMSIVDKISKRQFQANRCTK